MLEKVPWPQGHDSLDELLTLATGFLEPDAGFYLRRATIMVCDRYGAV